MNDKINPEETQSTKDLSSSKDQTAFSKSWFFKYILNNRYTSALMVGILIVIFVSLFTRVSYLLDPAVSFIQYVSLPIVVAAIFYYLTVPLVNQIEKGGLNRTWGSAIVLLLIAVVVTGLVALIPTVADEGRNLINNWDTIWTDYQSRLQTLIRGDWYDQVNMVVQSAMNNVLDLSSFNWESIANSAIISVSSIVGTVTRVTVAIFTAPIILFYMLRDGHKLPTYFAQFLPIKIRKSTLHLLSDMNLQISQYIRGQIIVAIGVAIMFVVGYSIVGLPYGVIIGVAAGFLNIIPYIGSFIAMVPAIIVAIVM
ncbi:MAG: AI-2E family transporter, partial [Aerococcus urinaeequi]|nr:AI-2E family transporter [Aerococcus urinaeequi]